MAFVALTLPGIAQEKLQAEPIEAAVPVETVEPAQPDDTQGPETWIGPGANPVDYFHPDYTGGPATPAYGGQVVLHLESMPKNFNRTVEISSVTRNLQNIVHEPLVVRDWETWELKPRLCTDWITEDTLVLVDEAAERYPAALRSKVQRQGPEGPVQVDVSILFGRIEESEDSVRITPLSGDNPLDEPLELPRADVAGMEFGTVFTFNLREDVLWHPARGERDGEAWEISGHAFDARDVQYSWSAYHNPDVECDEIRYQFLKIVRCDLLGSHTVRMFYESQYYAALASLGGEMHLVPSHIYDLRDPDNPLHDPEATPQQQARHFNEEPHNIEYVGLGPYRITEATPTTIECTRFEDYFLRSDPMECGYFDVIRYRLLDDASAFQALINEELDFFTRIKSADYRSAPTRSEAFLANFYAGHFYYNVVMYVVWNMYQPQFEDVAVRRAIAHAFDLEKLANTTYQGLVQQVTGPFPYHSNSYNHDVEPYPHDPERAVEILEDAGWYDSDGNGIVDRDGVELEFDYLLPTGNQASETIGLVMQESLAKVGMKVNITSLDWAAFRERIKNREHTCANLAWLSPLEPDPEQTWHSKWGARDLTSSNYSGFGDPEVDRWIEQGQRELDEDKRMQLWHKIHQRIYEQQPYLFMYNVPRKFAMNKKIRGFQVYTPRPGYYPRRWYYPAGTPGTRAAIDG